MTKSNNQEFKSSFEDFLKSGTKIEMRTTGVGISVSVEGHLSYLSMLLQLAMGRNRELIPVMLAAIATLDSDAAVAFRKELDKHTFSLP